MNLDVPNHDLIRYPSKECRILVELLIQYKLKMIRIITSLILCFISISACVQPVTTLTEKEIQAIDSLLVMDVPEGAPGLAIGIVRHGRVIYENYAGYANLEDSTLIDGRTRFNIASNGKQFTALAALQLAEQNQLNLDADIRNYLPGFFENVKEEITVKHLLNHSSGIRDFYDLLSLQGKMWWRVSANNQDVLALLKKQDELNFEPGSQFLYSNSNYVMLAEIISNVSGQSFSTYTRGLFDDLDMNSTSFEPDHSQISEPIAMPYFNFDTWTTYNWISDIVGDGALFSTLPDQLKWEKIIQTHNSYPISADVIGKSQKAVSDSEFTKYGYGIEFEEYKGERLLFHSGSTGAWKAITYRFPERNLAIIVLTNSGKVLPSITVKAVSDVLLGEKNTEEMYLLAPDKIGERMEIDEVLGTYQNENGFTFRFVEREGSLYLLRNGRNDIQLIRESANIFHQWNDPKFKQEFTSNSENGMQVTAYHTSHAPYTLNRIEADFTNYDFSSPEGRYLNSETDVLLEISYTGDKNYKVTIAGREYSGHLLKPTLLKAGNYSIHINYKENQVINLQLDGDRIRSVNFQSK